MKKLIVILSLTFTTLFASAHCCYRPGFGWMGPTIIGGVIGYEIARSQEPVIVQQPIIVQQQVQPQVITDPNIVVINGVIYHRQFMNINGVLQEVLVK
jgi:hypothetical protein